MKSISYKTTFIILLALSSFKVSGQGKVSDPHAGHAAHAGHSSSEPNKATSSPSTKKYQQINNNMHKSMDIKFTGDADKDFLAAMIPHHQGAIDMAEVVLQHGKNPKIRQLAQEIITMQKKEIAEMRQLLKEPK